MFPPSASARGHRRAAPAAARPGERARAFHDFREPIHKLGLMGEWDRLALFEAPASPELVGKDFATIGRERGQHPLDAMMDILLEAGDDAPNVLFVGLVQTQEDLDLTFASATCVARIRRHDAGAGRAARRAALPRRLHLGRVLPALHRPGASASLTLEEGIRRLTSMPARRVGLDRPRRRSCRAPGRTSRCSTPRRSRIAARSRHRTPSRSASATCSSTAGQRSRDGAFVDAAAGAVLRRSRARGRGMIHAEGSPAMTIMTVLGPIEDDELGVTQPHEHLLVNLYKTVTVWNYSAFEDEALAIEELGVVHGRRRAVDRRDDDDRDRAAARGPAPDRRRRPGSTS